MPPEAPWNISPEETLSILAWIGNPWNIHVMWCTETSPLDDTLSLLSDLGHYSPVYDTLQNVPNSRAWSAKPNVIKNILPHDFTIFVTECDFCHIRTFGGWTFSLLKTGPCFAALCKRLHLEAAVFPSNFSASCSCLQDVLMFHAFFLPKNASAGEILISPESPLFAL